MSCVLCHLPPADCEHCECLKCDKMCDWDDLNDYHCEDCNNCEECGAEQCMEWAFDKEAKCDKWVCHYCQEDESDEEEEAVFPPEPEAKPTQEPIQTYTHLWAF